MIYGSAIFVFLVLVGFVLTLKESPGPSTSKPDSASPTQDSDLRHKVGEDVFAGYWAYRCESARWQNTVPIGGGYTQQANAKYLVVRLGFRNNDTSPSMLPPAKLLDDAGKEYETDPEVSVLLTSLNPGVTGSGNLVFDVPPGKYTLKLSGGFTSGQSVLVDMPLPGK